MEPGLRSHIVPAAIALFGAVAALFFLPLRPVLVLSQTRTGRTLAELPFRKGDRFELAYVHSVNRGAVVDYFIIDQTGAVVLTHSVFQSFGAGMEEGLPGAAPVSLEKEGLVLRGLDRRLGILTLAVGSVADHRLRWEREREHPGGSELPLLELAEPLTFVSIAYERRSILSPLLDFFSKRFLYGRS